MRVFTLLCFCLLSICANATHILGGFITYTHLSDSTYTVKLTIYRECTSGTLFDGDSGSVTPAIVGLFEAGTNILVNVLDAGAPVVSTIAPIIQDTSCHTGADLCAEKGVYTFNVTLPSSTQAYTLTHERCCLPSIINNVENAGDVGSVFSATIPAVPNSSPVLTIIPPLYVSLFHTFNFENWCTDPEGDSLTYSLMTPFSAGSATAPAPNPPYGPPYNPLQWISYYNAAMPLGTTSYFNLDTVNGHISGEPRWSGSYLVGIKVTEYHNGNWLAEYPLTFTINATDCNYDTTYRQPAALPTAIENAENADIVIFPNPANNTLTVKGFSGTQHNVNLIDLNGKVLLSEVAEKGEYTFSTLNQFASGVYILQVGNYRKRIIIQ